MAKTEISGGHVSYYSVEILHPSKPGRPAYIAEAQDVIEALGLDFNEGEIFKAVWRNGAMRKLKSQKEGDTELRNAEKCEYFGRRMAERLRNETKIASEEAPHFLKVSSIKKD